MEWAQEGATAFGRRPLAGRAMSDVLLSRGSADVERRVAVTEQCQRSPTGGAHVETRGRSSPNAIACDDRLKNREVVGPRGFESPLGRQGGRYLADLPEDTPWLGLLRNWFPAASTMLWWNATSSS